MGDVVTAKFHQHNAAPTCRVRFQGHSPISIRDHPELGLWEPGRYRDVPVELAEELMWQARQHGDESYPPDFVDCTGQPDIEPTVNTRKALFAAEAALRG